MADKDDISSDLDAFFDQVGGGGISPEDFEPDGDEPETSVDMPAVKDDPAPEQQGAADALKRGAVPAGMSTEDADALIAQILGSPSEREGAGPAPEAAAGPPELAPETEGAPAEEPSVSWLDDFAADDDMVEIGSAAGEPVQEAASAAPVAEETASAEVTVEAGAADESLERAAETEPAAELAARAPAEEAEEALPEEAPVEAAVEEMVEDGAGAPAAAAEEPEAVEVEELEPAAASVEMTVEDEAPAGALTQEELAQVESAEAPAETELPRDEPVTAPASWAIDENEETQEVEEVAFAESAPAEAAAEPATAEAQAVAAAERAATRGDLKHAWVPAIIFDDEHPVPAEKVDTSELLAVDAPLEEGAAAGRLLDEDISRPWRIVALFAWGFMIWALSGAPAENIPSVGLVGADKLAHMVAFGVLAVLFCRLLYGERPERKVALIFFVAVVATALYGAMTEYHQLAVGRHFSVWDMAANLVGALVGSALYATSPGALRAGGGTPMIAGA